MNPIEQPRVIHADPVPVTQVPPRPSIAKQVATMAEKATPNPVLAKTDAVMRAFPPRGAVLNSNLTRSIQAAEGISDSTARVHIQMAYNARLIEPVPMIRRPSWELTKTGRARKQEIEAHGSQNQAQA